MGAAAAGETAMNTQTRTLRIYNQLKARTHLPLNTHMLRFHPALGYF
jgi:hypothetical protein